MKYVINKYLYCKEKDEKIFIVHILKNTIFTLDKKDYDLLRPETLHVLETEKPDLFKKMISTGILVPADIEQKKIFEIKNKVEIFDNRVYRLTINPTLECNFRCWYCYEKHPKGRMSDNMLDCVVKHIQNKIENEKIAMLHLDFFGGEPFLYYNEIMRPLLQKAKELSINNNVDFFAGATTNGFLITDEQIKEFNDVKLKNFQITLDGNRNQHNKIRFSVGKKGSFDKIIENINKLCKIPSIDILLRINYTEDTLKNIEESVVELSPKAREVVTVKFQQVWQDVYKNQISAEDCEQQFINLGFKVEQSEFNCKGYVCYADKLQQAVINYDGKVYKCTARDFATYPADGNLLENGNIKWNNELFIKRFCKATFDNKYCNACNFLPICYGPCSQKIMELQDENHFERICYKNGIISMLEKEIEKS
ncbi:MAG: radical SAM protein [Paludibacter sp.]|nr:radical SAM protein [Paludibacter sp.]